MGTTERFDTAAAGFRARLAALDPSDGAMPSPCDEWTADEVVDHAVGVVVQVTNLVEPPIDDDVSATAISRFDVATADLHGKLENPELSAMIVESPVGAIALRQLVSSIVVHDLLVHTWDLARAVGGDEKLDAELVAHTFASMTPYDDMLRGHGFADKVVVPDDADEQTRLLAFLGRQP